MCYRELQGVRGGYKRLQGVTKGYRGLHGVTSGYRGLQGVTGGYKGLQGVTDSNRWLQMITGVLQLVIGWLITTTRNFFTCASLTQQKLISRLGVGNHTSQLKLEAIWCSLSECKIF